jgi:hypothetical protein
MPIPLQSPSSHHRMFKIPSLQEKHALAPLRVLLWWSTVPLRSPLPHKEQSLWGNILSQCVSLVTFFTVLSEITKFWLIILIILLSNLFYFYLIYIIPEFCPILIKIISINNVSFSFGDFCTPLTFNKSLKIILALPPPNFQY